MIQFDELIFQMGGGLKNHQLVLQSLEAKRDVSGSVDERWYSKGMSVCHKLGMFHEITSRCKCEEQWTSPD